MRLLLPLLLAVVGCHEVWTTGSRGIRGVLLDSGGAPIGRQRVTSEDHGATTDHEGRFEVRWKDPTTFVDIKRGGVTWRRTWRPKVDRGIVRVQLPPVRAGEIDCRTELECLADVRWEFPDGLSAFTTIACGERTPSLRVGALPYVQPSIRCTTIVGDLDLDITDRDDRLTVRSQPQPQAVGVADDGDGACRVAVLKGEVIEGVNQVGLRVSGPTWAWSVCRGRVGPPVAVEPLARGVRRTVDELMLPQASEGVDLSLDPPLDDPAGLRLVRRNPDGTVDWELRVEPVDGTYRLPPLPRGEYRLGWGAAQVFASVNPPDPEIPGTVVIVARSGPWGERGGYVGALRLEEDTPRGTLAVDGHPPEVYLAD